MKVTVLGAGNMGTAIAKVLGDNGNEVYLWNYEGDPDPINQIADAGENKKYLPGVKLPETIHPTFDMAEAVSDSSVVFFIVPSCFIKRILDTALPFLSEDAVLVDVSKGLCSESLGIIPLLMKDAVTGKLKDNIVGMSGPAIAKQIAAGGFTAMDIASENAEALEKVCEVFVNEHMKCVKHSDVVGVELGGSFKNVYAILLGVCDGVGHDLNLKSALLTRALAEIVEVGVAMGAKKETFYSLAGLGDLIGTALSPDSRNRRFGEYIGSGMNKDEALEKVGQVVEGLDAVESFLKLAEKYNIDTPLARLVLELVDCDDKRGVIDAYLAESF